MSKKNILQEIVERRQADLNRLGASLGFEIPLKRTRQVVPFLDSDSCIFEIKRASPSKGDIAPDLIPEVLAKTYANAGAKAISVLTESHFFKGSLNDLMAVSNTVEHCSILRKDFILQEDEVEVSYLCGADAVLLIARILDVDLLVTLAKKIHSYSMTPFLEVRSVEDFEKLKRVLQEVSVVAGVNSRDLKSFKMDALIPAALQEKLPAQAVFESGIHSPEDAAFAKMLGFKGILVGESVAKSPDKAQPIVKAFENASANKLGDFCKKIAQRRELKKQENKACLVKICGITRVEDALLAAQLGADLLGFVFAESPRKTDLKNLSLIQEALDNKGLKVLRVGVVTDLESSLGKEALLGIHQGLLDAIQVHDSLLPSLLDANVCPRYGAIRLGSEKDIENLRDYLGKGEPRVLIDAKSEKALGGTGDSIPVELVLEAKKHAPLWIAGGVSPQNIRSIIRDFNPELVDLSSSIESENGVKSKEKLELFFKEFNNE